MNRIIAAGCVLCAAVASGAYAATAMSSAPAESWTVTNYYKQAVYDPKESRIGDIDDVLVDKSGKVTGLVLGVGGCGRKRHHRSICGRKDDEEKRQMVADARRDQGRSQKCFRFQVR
jgi:hypothetical protein